MAGWKQLLLLAVAAVSVQAKPLAFHFSQAEIDAGQALTNLSKTAYDIAMARAEQGKNGCTKDKVKVRKEW